MKPAQMAPESHRSEHIGGANIWKGAWRVGFWGALAMAITAGIGALFGTVV